MKTFVILLGCVLIVASYLVGYLPEHRRLGELRKNAETAKVQLTEAQDRLRVYSLQNRLLSLTEKVLERNYGEAQKLSSDFFDQVREEISQTRNVEIQSALQIVLGMRDSITAGLAKADPATSGLLQQAMKKMQEIPARCGEWGDPKNPYWGANGRKRPLQPAAGRLDVRAKL